MAPKKQTAGAAAAAVATGSLLTPIGVLRVTGTATHILTVAFPDLKAPAHMPPAEPQAAAVSATASDSKALAMAMAQAVRRFRRSWRSA